MGPRVGCTPERELHRLALRALASAAEDVPCAFTSRKFYVLSPVVAAWIKNLVKKQVGIL